MEDKDNCPSDPEHYLFQVGGEKGRGGRNGGVRQRVPIQTRWQHTGRKGRGGKAGVGHKGTGDLGRPETL